MTTARAFSLIEVMVARVVLTILLSGLALPLAAQLTLRRMDETRRQLDEAKEAKGSNAQDTDLDADDLQALLGRFLRGRLVVAGRED